ncbi:ATP-binding protein, partial [Candidatus Saccharibacteria bacterium]|nr:ATP-binding protein [Candidatus Saccharibacteria bacterium]
NYKSFKEKQEITFLENEKNVTAFFGPNSSGKSNLFSALQFYCEYILESTNFHRKKVLHGENFRFTKSCAQKDSVLSAEFKNDTYQYKYSFSITREGEVSEEHLSRKKLGDVSYKTIFSRGSIINNRYGEFGFPSKMLKETRSDSLILTRAYAANNKIAKDVFSCIESITFFSGAGSAIKNFGHTAEIASDDPQKKNDILRFLKLADLYIQDFTVEKNNQLNEIDSSLFSADMINLLRRSTYKITTTHSVRDEAGNVISLTNMSMRENESAGTNQIFEYAGWILEALKEGKVLYVDELGINLHPKECSFIVNLFDKTYGENTKNGQLIINTHETGLIDILGKDNCYFLGKDLFEATLVEKLSGIRTEEKNLSKKYNAGLYGAVPQIGLRKK